MKVKLIASFLEPSGKGKVKLHSITITEATPLIATLTLERFLDGFYPGCHTFRSSMESSK